MTRPLLYHLRTQLVSTTLNDLMLTLHFLSFFVTGLSALLWHDLGLKYGVVTTYEETVFLRQKSFQQKIGG